jgi:signal transduction histidine kinase
MSASVHRDIRVRKSSSLPGRSSRQEVVVTREAQSRVRDTPSKVDWPEVERETVETAFGKGVLVGQDTERKRVAQELHDDISQRLSLAGLELNEVEQLVRTAGSCETEQKLRTVRRRIESIAQDVKRISHNLHPTTLEHLGLLSALHALCRDFSEHTGISVEFTSDIRSPLLSRDVAIALYRVAQECLTNIGRHSGSQQAQVSLIERSGVLQLTITDRGVGFDINELASKAGLGLVNIRARVRSVGGDVQLTSAPGRGTTVTVQLPGAERVSPE